MSALPTPIGLLEQYFQTQLTRSSLSRKGEAALRKLEEPATGVGLSLAVAIGVSLMTANPVIGIAAGTALNPTLAHLAKQKLSRTDRAVGLLQALL